MSTFSYLKWGRTGDDCDLLPPFWLEPWLLQLYTLTDTNPNNVGGPPRLGGLQSYSHHQSGVRWSHHIPNPDINEFISLFHAILKDARQMDIAFLVRGFSASRSLLGNWDPITCWNDNMIQLLEEKRDHQWWACTLLLQWWQNFTGQCKLTAVYWTAK